VCDLSLFRTWSLCRDNEEEHCPVAQVPDRGSTVPDTGSSDCEADV